MDVTRRPRARNVIDAHKGSPQRERRRLAAFLTGQTLDVDALAPVADGTLFSAFIRERRPLPCHPVSLT